MSLLAITTSAEQSPGVFRPCGPHMPQYAALFQEIGSQTVPCMPQPLHEACEHGHIEIIKALLADKRLSLEQLEERSSDGKNVAMAVAGRYDISENLKEGLEMIDMIADAIRLRRVLEQEQN